MTSIIDIEGVISLAIARGRKEDAVSIDVAGELTTINAIKGYPFACTTHVDYRRGEH